jgi:O-antigen/teichoic acid export membrane protein
LRTEKSIKNVGYAIVGQILGIFLAFIARMIFLKYLGEENLGVSSLFTNILSILSLAELGLTTSITYSLYKPIAEGDRQKIAKIINFSKKAYRYVMIVIVILGLGMSFFLNNFMETTPNISENLYIIFVLYVLNSALTYLTAHRRILLIADQRKYIASIYRYSVYALMTALQILVIIVFKSFIVFLLVQTICVFLENALIFSKVGREYPYITANASEKLDSISSKEIKRNMSAMFMHRLSTVFATSISSIIISSLIGVVEVGKYTNYIMIITAVSTLVSQIFEAITASVGNLGVSTNEEYQKKIFNRILYMNHIIISFCAISLLVLFNQFIGVWMGADMVFPFSSVILIVLRFYIDGIRKTVLLFRNAYGLFWYDRYKAVLEAGLIVALSYLLGKNYGLNGILLGSILGTVLATTIVEPYILFKYGFKKGLKDYFLKVLVYIVMFASILAIVWYVCSLYENLTFIYMFILEIITLVVMIPLIYTLLTFKTDNFKYFTTLIKEILKKVKGKIKHE